MDLKDRFLKYVSFDTQADESSTSFPSTEKQLVLLRYLKEELETIGLVDVTMDEYGYVMGTLPATKGYEKAPVIGFISHVDTAPDMSGANVKPQVVTGGALDISILNINQDNVFLDGMKLAEDGSGDIILRFYEAMDSAVTAEIKWNLPTYKAYMCDMMENVIEEIEIKDETMELPFRAFEIKTIRMVKEI